MEKLTTKIIMLLMAAGLLATGCASQTETEAEPTSPPVAETKAAEEPPAAPPVAEAPPMEEKTGDYVVKRGDNLWNIAGRDDIYANAYQWPLIYRANQDKIRDADLIYPGQAFSIDRNASSSDVQAAVQHAKTRGAWSLGAVEASDKAYLAAN